MSETMPVKLQGAMTLSFQDMKVFPLHDMASGQCSCDRGAECKEGGKHPRISAWQSNATDNKRQLERWWKQWPEANIGVATGEKSGLFVIDIDDEDGHSKLKELIDGLPTPTSFSARGMPHYWFKFPEGADITNRRGGLPVGVDVRGNGGFIIAPPSVSYKGEYKFNGSTIANLIEPSEKLLSLLKPSESETQLVDASKVKKHNDLSESKRERYESYWHKVYVDEIKKIEELGPEDAGQWNHTLYTSSLRLFELLKTPWIPEDDFDAIKEDILSACVPNYDNDGWNRSRCMDTINSAFRHVMKDNKVLPEPASAQKKEWPEKTRERNKARIVFFSEVKAQPIEWYEEPWLPVSGLTGLAGPEDTGKSTYFMYEIAKLTTGAFGRPPIKVLYFGQEDDDSMTKARLKLAGADMTKVAYIKIDVPLDEESTYERDLNLKEDLETLREALHDDPEIKAVYLDPANSFLGIDEDKDGYSTIRAALERMNKFAKREKILVRAMKHTKKQNGQVLPMVSMVFGSKAWTEVIRVFPILWPVEEKLQDKLGLGVEDMTNLVLLRGKNNYAPKDLPAKGLCIDSKPVQMDGFTYDNVTFMKFTRSHDLTNDEIQDKLAETKQEAKERQVEENDTDVWLREFLSKHGKTRRKEVMDAYKVEKIATSRTLQKRANSMGIIKEPIPGTNNEVYWSLPSNQVIADPLMS